MAEWIFETDLADFLRVDPTRVAGFQFHINLARGLVAEQIGDQDPWSATARAIILTAAARAFYNPEGLKSETTGPFTAVRDAAALGVYLTDAEIDRLHHAPGPVDAASGPLGEFPDPLPDVDPPRVILGWAR